MMSIVSFWCSALSSLVIDKHTCGQTQLDVKSFMDKFYPLKNHSDVVTCKLHNRSVAGGFADFTQYCNYAGSVLQKEKLKPATL